jgi:hypothetical protein
MDHEFVLVSLGEKGIVVSKARRGKPGRKISLLVETGGIPLRSV